MGRKHAKIISRDAFMQSFVEAEVIMRKNLGARIENLIEKETNPDIITGLKQAQELVVGKVEENGSE
jgi:hypothetical protein